MYQYKRKKTAEPDLQICAYQSDPDPQDAGVAVWIFGSPHGYLVLLREGYSWVARSEATAAAVQQRSSTTCNNGQLVR
jgi:hypothetical protein